MKNLINACLVAFFIFSCGTAEIEKAASAAKKTDTTGEEPKEEPIDPDDPVYSVSIDLAGLVGNITIKNGSNTLTINSSGIYLLTEELFNSTNYNIQITSQPSNQVCVPVNGAGTINGKDVVVDINCESNVYGISVNVSGLASSTTLKVNSGSNQVVNSNGTTLLSSLANGATYNVVVVSQPTSPNQVCTISSGSGTVNSASVSVNVNCVTTQYTVSVDVAGLAGTLQLRNNGANTLTFNADGIQSFPVQNDGSSYNVTVLSEPTLQDCVVTGSTGNLSGSNITLDVDCELVLTIASTGANGRTYRSLDGASWTQGSYGASTTVGRLKRDIYGNLLAVAVNQTIKFSSDNGATWVNRPLPANCAIYDVAWSMENQYWLAVGGSLADTTKSCTARSSDFGQTWTIASGQITVVNKPNVIDCYNRYWYSGPTKLWDSTCVIAGGEWIGTIGEDGTGPSIVDSNLGCSFSDITIAKQASNNLQYYPIIATGSGNGACLATNIGNSGTHNFTVREWPSETVMGKAIKIGNSAWIAVGSTVQVSGDDGKTWTERYNVPDGKLFKDVVDVDGIFYASGTDGIFKSTDGGYNWTNIVFWSLKTLYAIEYEHVYWQQ